MIKMTVKSYAERIGEKKITVLKRIGRNDMGRLDGILKIEKIGNIFILQVDEKKLPNNQ